MTVPHNRLTHGDREVELVTDVVRSGEWAGGPRVEELERRLSDMAGVSHAVAVASGSDALRLALSALGAGESNAVVVPAYSCVATANAALACGAAVVAADVEEDTWNLPAAEAQQAVTGTANVSAIVAVDTFGVPAPVPELGRLGVPVVEDCAHAFGAKVDGGPLGGRSLVAISSFYATKLVGGGEGGAVLTDDQAIADRVREWRNYDEREPDRLRLNNRMNDLEAALVLAQLERLPDLIEARRVRAERYLELLQTLESPGVRLPTSGPERVWYRFAVETAAAAKEVVGGLARYGIEGAVPVSRWGTHVQPRPVAERAFAHVVSLPLYPSLTREEQDRCVRALGLVLGEVGGTER